MRHLTASELEAVIAESHILVGTAQHPGILQTPEGKIVKFFYRRKRFSTSTFIPQARRFALNSKKLEAMRVVAPVVEDLAYCREKPVHMVVYQRIRGDDVRHLCEQGDLSALDAVPGFLADLHEKGIYFRAVHLGNLLRSGEGFALLDISDLSTRRLPLGVLLRARNIAHLLNTREDNVWFTGESCNRFIDEYISVSQLSGWRAWLFRLRLAIALDRDRASA